MVPVVPGPHLADDEHVGPVHPGVLDGLRHEGLGAVALGGIDQAIPTLPDGVHHRLVVVPTVVACSWGTEMIKKAGFLNISGWL